MGDGEITMLIRTAAECPVLCFEPGIEAVVFDVSDFSPADPETSATLAAAWTPCPPLALSMLA